MIQVTALTKSYGSIQVLNNIHFTFLEGHVYGIVGENGAGKTTLFKCIAGIEKHEGEITSQYSPLKNYVGFLMTEPYLFSKITGKEYIQLLCNARGKKNDVEQKNIFDLPLNQYVSTYSTGMKKKLAITAILLQENNYFILDEPFNGVDIQSNIIITEIIHKLKELNKIVLISSHIFSTLNDTCDEIHLLEKGSITKSVKKEGFSELEAEMKKNLVGNKINQLELK